MLAHLAVCAHSGLPDETNRRKTVSYRAHVEID